MGSVRLKRCHGSSQDYYVPNSELLGRLWIALEFVFVNLLLVLSPRFELRGQEAFSALIT